jgi:site-specific recombinase XerD
VGGNAFELQALLGHESLTMTEHYVHRNWSRLS